MSELLIVGFREKHRASELFFQMQHGEREFVPDLLNAIVLMTDDRRRIIVEQRINLDNAESAGWSKFWGALIGAAMLTPFFADNSKIVGEIEAVSKPPSEPLESHAPFKWWNEQLKISKNFTRDVAALVQTNSSTMMMVVGGDEENDRHANGDAFADGCLLRQHLTDRQIEKIREYILPVLQCRTV